MAIVYGGMSEAKYIAILGEKKAKCRERLVSKLEVHLLAA